MTTSKTIKVDYLARVEGEGALYLKFKDDQVETVHLKIFEPPRFFEAFLQDRHFSEAPDITARICGICPIAYQMSAVHAIERALGISIDGPIRELRRLFYCGEWIESHTLHIYMLHAPDFLGFESALHMAEKHSDIVKQGLQLKKAGNALVTFLGGREIHPINVRVGGFYKVPTPKELQTLKEMFVQARDLAEETVRWTATLPFPDFEMDYEFVALSHPTEYPFNEGRLVSNQGLDIDVKEYEAHFEEEHVEHSNALHSIHNGHGAYFVGPLARYNLNYDRLPSSIQNLAQEVGIGPSCKNPFESIVIRSIEVLYACEEVLRILNSYEMPDSPFVESPSQAGTGWACTEAPRGILYHRYQIDEEGLIQQAKIVPPTSQNQKIIEDDLKKLVQTHHSLPEDELTWKCEQTIRNYDPCISCATHFLKLHIEQN